MDHNYGITHFRVNRQNKEISDEEKTFREKRDPYQWGKRTKQKQEKKSEKRKKKIVCKTTCPTPKTEKIHRYN